MADDDIVYVRVTRRISPWETVAFALLCLIAAGTGWYLWTSTPHRPALKAVEAPAE